MNSTRRTAALATLALTATLSVVGATTTTAHAAMPKPFANCTQLNQAYPHGVGKTNARDKTSGTPVTTFKKSTRLYNRANNANGGLDRDNDNIACEKA